MSSLKSDLASTTEPSIDTGPQAANPQSAKQRTSNQSSGSRAQISESTAASEDIQNQTDYSNQKQPTGFKLNINSDQRRPRPACFRANSDVAPVLAEIDKECNRPPWNTGMFASEFGTPFSRVFCARWGGEIVGFLVAHVVADEAHILNFGIRQAVRRQGIGRELLSYALLDFHASGARWATLEVRRSNLGGQGLYESFGFYEVGVREKYYTDDREDALVMSLTLPQYSRQASLMRSRYSAE